MMRLRTLALGVAALLSAAAPIWLPGAARAGDITYPGLNAATTVQDTDLLATWRASGPLTKIQASVLEAYIQGKLGGSFLQQSNNLSDLASITAARTNLGLGSAALASTGTTGTALCQLNSNCTWTGTEAFNAAVTMGSTLGVTGLLSAAGGEAITGNLTVSGTTTDTGLATFNGGLTVAAGATTLTGTNNVNGPAGTTRGIALQSVGTSTVPRWLLFESSAAETGSNTGSDFGICRYSDIGAQIDCPFGFSRATGILTLTDGLSVSGPVSLPAASVVNSNLDAVNGSSGPCGSATTTCTFTTNAQGRITAQGSATIQPDTCAINNTSGYCKNPNGYVHQWYHFDSGSFNGWAGGPTTITFPFSPSHGCFSYTAITDNQGSQGSPYYALQIVSSPGGNSVTVSAAGFQSGSHSNIQGFYATADCY